MAQLRKPKLSSRSKAVWAAATDDAIDKVLQNESSEVVVEVLLAKTYSHRKQMLLDLVNMRDREGAQWFANRWNNRVRPEKLSDFIALRNELRAMWGMHDAEASDATLNRWLYWRPTSKQLIRWSDMDTTHDTQKIKAYMPYSCSVETARLIPDFRGFRGMLIQGVLEHWPNFKVCANPDCTAPYFVAMRKDQTVCDAEICKAEKQRQHALKWWSEHRSKQALQAKPASAKSGKKGK